LVRQALADATGVTVEAPETEEPVLLGSAILGAMAAGLFPDAVAAMSAMSRCRDRYVPDFETAAWHDRRYALYNAFHALARDAAGGTHGDPSGGLV